MNWDDMEKNIEGKYDKTSPESIFYYSKGLIGKTLYEAVSMINPSISKEELSISGKGGLGQLVEKFFYEYKPNSKPTPDFEEAGVELKTTPLKKIKEDLQIKERLVCDMIDFCAIVNVGFEDSPFYKKCVLMLILFYLHEKGMEKRDLKFIYSALWRLQGKDLQIIRQDYQIIINKIKAGKAHELSEGDTMYLGACRKGQKDDSLRKQPYSELGAPRRAFSLKTAYMRTVLEYIKTSKKAMVTNTDYKTPDVELVSVGELRKRTFDQIITDRLMKYKGKDYKAIAKKFDTVISPKEKSKYSRVSWMILHGGKSEKETSEEIKKAGIIVKTIRVQKNGKIRENMSFQNIMYDEIYENDNFYDSQWYEIVTSKFMFVIFREADVPKRMQRQWNGETRYVLDKVIFWTMPPEDLEIAEQYWDNIRENVLADTHYTEPGNTFWKLADHRFFHVRPKAAVAADQHISPVSGRSIKKTCYWFNSEYVSTILRRDYGEEWDKIYGKH